MFYFNFILLFFCIVFFWASRQIKIQKLGRKGIFSLSYFQTGAVGGAWGRAAVLVDGSAESATVSRTQMFYFCTTFCSFKLQTFTLYSAWVDQLKIQRMATAVQDVNREPTLEEILKDFPPGPLDLYRKRASFDWKQMKLFIEGEDVLKFKVKKLLLKLNKICNLYGLSYFCKVLSVDIV